MSLATFGLVKPTIRGGDGGNHKEEEGGSSRFQWKNALDAATRSTTGCIHQKWICKRRNERDKLADRNFR